MPRSQSGHSIAAFRFLRIGLWQSQSVPAPVTSSLAVRPHLLGYSAAPWARRSSLRLYSYYLNFCEPHVKNTDYATYLHGFGKQVRQNHNYGHLLTKHQPRTKYFAFVSLSDCLTNLEVESSH